MLLRNSKIKHYFFNKKQLPCYVHINEKDTFSSAIPTPNKIAKTAAIYTRTTPHVQVWSCPANAISKTFFNTILKVKLINKGTK